MAEKREYVIYACTEPDCGYYRDSLSTGVHVTFPTRSGPAVRHKIAPLTVVPVEKKGQHLD